MLAPCHSPPHFRATGTGMEEGAGSALLPDSDSQLPRQLTALQSTTYQFQWPLGPVSKYYYFN